MRRATKKFFPTIFICLMFIGLNGQIFSQSGGSTALPAGKIIDKVECSGKPGHSYALYLPSGYTKNKNWPIIYLFEPGGRGKLPVGLFRDAAEKYGYILVCSNNVKNGPFRPIFDGVTAVWKDTRQRLTFDERRIYTGGFSGGARVASQFRFITQQPAAGIIGVGAGIGVRMKPGMLKPAEYFSIVGREDFNYREVNNLMKDFKAVSLVHRLRVYDASHAWPPKEICTEAVEWLEVMAMKKGARQMNAATISEVFKKYETLVKKQEENGDIAYAIETLESAIQLFDGFKSTKDLKTKLTALKASEDYKKYLKAEEKRREMEKSQIQVFANVIETILKSEGPWRESRMYQDMKLEHWRKEADKPDGKGDKYDRAMARRMLAQLRTHCIQEGEKQYKGKKYAKAGLLYEIAVKAGQENPLIYYNLACTYALDGKKGKALDYLEVAIEKGFKNLDFMKKDKDLDSLRSEKKYKKLVKKISN